MVTVTIGRFAGMNVSDTNSLNRQYEDYIASNPLSIEEIITLRDEKNKALQSLRGTPADVPLIRAETQKAMTEQQMHSVTDSVSGWPTSGPTPNYQKPNIPAYGLVSWMDANEAIASGSGRETVQSAVVSAANDYTDNSGKLHRGIDITPTAVQEGYVPEKAKSDMISNAQIAYDKSMYHERALLDLQPLWSPRGFEYIFSGFDKKIVIEQMAESRLDKEFVKKQAIGSLTGTPTGVIGVTVGAGYAIGAAGGAAAGSIAPRLAGGTLGKIGGALAAVNTNGANIIKIGVLSVAVGTEAVKIKSMTESSVTGAKIAGEVARDVTMFAGLGYGLQSGFQSGPGLVAKIGGAKYIPQSDITSKSVRLGEVTYPTTEPQNPNLMISAFKESKYVQNIIGKGKFGGIHTTGTISLSKSFVTQAGSSESPGLYIGAEAIPNYLRTGSSSLGVAGGKSPLLSQPKIWGVETPMAMRIPASVRGKGFEAMNKYLENEAKKGVPYVSPAYELGRKTEVELIISPSSKVLKTSGSSALGGSDAYTIVNDIYVPIFKGTTRTAQNAAGAVSIFKASSSLSSVSSSAQLSSSLFSAGLSASVIGLSSSSRIASSSVSSQIRSSPVRTSASPSVMASRMMSSSPISSFASSSAASSSLASSMPSPSSSFSIASSSMVSPTRTMPSSILETPSGARFVPPTGMTGGKLFKRRTRLTRKDRYAPSVGGILLGKLVKKAPKGRFTGLEIRPVVIKKGSVKM